MTSSQLASDSCADLCPTEHLTTDPWAPTLRAAGHLLKVVLLGAVVLNSYYVIRMT